MAVISITVNRKLLMMKISLIRLREQGSVISKTISKVVQVSKIFAMIQNQKTFETS